jgi:hypothetical protein
MRVLPAISLTIVLLLMITDLEIALTVGGGLAVLAGLLWGLEKLINKKVSSNWFAGFVLSEPSCILVARVDAALSFPPVPIPFPIILASHRVLSDPPPISPRLAHSDHWLGHTA